MSLLALTLHYQGQRNTGFMIHYGSLKFDLIMNQMANLSIVLLSERPIEIFFILTDINKGLADMADY